MQKQLLVEASKLLPDFNDYILLKYREEKIGKMETYLDALFQESVKLFGGQLRYVGYTELNPDDRLSYIRDNPILRKKIDIQKSSFKVLRFEFEYEGVRHALHAAIPYMDHGRVLLGGTEYFPLLFIVEKGALHRTARDVIIKVMRAPLTFKRSERYMFKTLTGETYNEIVVTVKIHQRKKGRGGKRTDRTPLLLYHLVKLSFDKTMSYYGFAPGEISIVTEVCEDPQFKHIQLRDSIYLRVHQSAFANLYKRRVIASYLMCLEEWPKYSYRDLIAVHPVYYKTILGKYTYPSNTNGTLLFENAEKHLETTDTLLDPPTQYQLSTIGIQAADIYELLKVVFFNIDRWIIDYNPIDLYQKKIGALDQMMAGLVTTINNKQFPIINSKTQGINQETVRKFVTSASQYEGWLAGNPMFRANPSMCNDNILFAILTKRVRSLENTETRAAAGKAKGKNMPVGLLKAHPSNMVVESICSLPPSAPVITGEINPYLEITTNGDIVKPAWAEKLNHIFD